MRLGVWARGKSSGGRGGGGSWFVYMCMIVFFGVFCVLFFSSIYPGILWVKVFLFLLVVVATLEHSLRRS